MQNIINLNNQNERLKAQNKSLQQEKRALRGKIRAAEKGLKAILDGSLPCGLNCTLDDKCFDEVTNNGKTCMIRLAQKALKVLNNEQ